MNVKTAEKLLLPITTKHILKAKRVLRQRFTKNTPIELISPEEIGVLRYPNRPNEVNYYYKDCHYVLSLVAIDTITIPFLWTGRPGHWGRRNTQKIIITWQNYDKLVATVRAM